MKNIAKLYKSGKTVFKRQEIGNILNLNKKSLEMFVYRNLKSGHLQKIHYGIYALWKYDVFELAGKLKKKSYISLETVLKQEGVIFQYYTNIFSVSDDTIKKTVDNHRFVYHKIHDSILSNPIGLVSTNAYTIATVERAICDRIYFSSQYYFDDLSWIDFEALIKISQIYNKRVQKEIILLQQQYV